MITKSLASIVGIIWLIAGFNICRTGVVAWSYIANISVFMIIGSIVTMILFSRMFVKMLFKNVQRIRDIEVEKRKVWNMMPVKSYVIMALMITFGIMLRRCPIILPSFIASFYVRLGIALILAGIIYISVFLCPKYL